MSRFFIMIVFLVFFLSIFNYVCVYDLCSVQENLCSDKHVLDNCKVKSMNFDARDCSHIQFYSNEKDVNELGEVLIQVDYDIYSQLFLNITFSDVKWKRGYIRLSDRNNRNENVCKMYTVEKEVPVPLNTNLYDSCLWSTAKKLRAKTYLLEYRVENVLDRMYKKVLFELPNINYFGDNIALTKRLIFSYIDFTNNYEIILNIQTLPVSYNVTQYKVEVFRERDTKTIMLDIRIIKYKGESVLKLEVPTYNEEGYYHFTISVVSDRCLEDMCTKTITPKVFISRKGNPLVIGIVSAGFIIPFVLFVFHMWNRKFKDQGGISETVEKILILFNPSSDKHNDVVSTLAKTVKQLTGIEVMLDPVNLTKTKQKNSEQWCSDNLIVASHIIYVTPPSVDDRNCELDYMTYNFLKEETKKSIPEKDIIVLNLPYSTTDIPSILANCIKFELMDDFHKFLNLFQPIPPEFSYEDNINCVELVKKIKLAQLETEFIRNKDAPRVIVNDQIERTEAKEIDVLL